MLHPAFRDPATAPRDGTMLRLLVKFTQSPTEDEDQCVTIGFATSEINDEKVWKFAGWNWSHDFFNEGQGEVIGWLPMFSDAELAEAGKPKTGIDYDFCDGVCDD